MTRAETMTMTDAWTREEFEKRLRERGTAYHIHHAFNVMLNTGKATPQQIRGWVANRYYYQIAIPIKDAAVLSNCPDREMRRQWVQRILDHDGHGDDPGGIEAWVQLGLAVGLKREELTDLRHVVPGVRFAVDAYVNFARRAPWQEAMCAFADRIVRAEDPSRAPGHMARALSVDRDGGPAVLPQSRHPGAARRRAGLQITLGYFTTIEAQQRALDILQFKLDILWSMNDAMALAYGVGA
jgi:pyrroloquinoline-quinone synthase